MEYFLCSREGQGIFLCSRDGTGNISVLEMGQGICSRGGTTEYSLRSRNGKPFMLVMLAVTFFVPVPVAMKQVCLNVIQETYVLPKRIRSLSI